MKLGQSFLYTYSESDGCHSDKVGDHRPAVVVRDWGGCGNVQVFTDGVNDFEGGTPGSDGLLHLTSRCYTDAPEPGCLSSLDSTTALKLEPKKPAKVQEAPPGEDTQASGVAPPPEGQAAKPTKAPRAKKPKAVPPPAETEEEPPAA